MGRESGSPGFILKIMIAAASVCLAVVAVLLFSYVRLPKVQYRRNLNLGNKYLLAMQYDDAVSAFSKAIEIEPKKAEAYVGRGDAYAGLKQDEKAQADYIKAVELDPELNDKVQEKINRLNIAAPAPTAPPVLSVTQTPAEDLAPTSPPAATAAPEVTVAPAATATPEPTESPKVFGGVVSLNEDSTTEADLNSNGNVDRIYYSMISSDGNYANGIQIDVNGIQLSDELNFTASLRGIKAYAADINLNDAYKNVIVVLSGDDLDEVSLVYAYSDSGIQRVDRFNGEVEPGSITGDGRINFYFFNNWRTKPDGIICLCDIQMLQGLSASQASRTVGHLTDESDIKHNVSTYVDGYTVTATADIPFYSDEMCTQQEGSLSSGETFEIISYVRNEEDNYIYNYQVVSDHAGKGWVRWRDLVHNVAGYTGFA